LIENKEEEHCRKNLPEDAKNIPQQQLKSIKKNKKKANNAKSSAKSSDC